MEPQTRFDLTQAIVQWRKELMARPGLVADEVKELESHLGEQVSTYVSKGINDQDAFWLAKRHLGSSDELVGEFRSANPQRAWSERMLWMVFGIAAYWTWQYFSGFAVIFAYTVFSPLSRRYEGNWATAIASLSLAAAFACLILGASRGSLVSSWKNDRLQRISTWLVGFWLVLQTAVLFMTYHNAIVRLTGGDGQAGLVMIRGMTQLMAPAVLFGWLLMGTRRTAKAEKA